MLSWVSCACLKIDRWYQQHELRLVNHVPGLNVSLSVQSSNSLHAGLDLFARYRGLQTRQLAVRAATHSTGFEWAFISMLIISNFSLSQPLVIFLPTSCTVPLVPVSHRTCHFCHFCQIYLALHHLENFSEPLPPTFRDPLLPCRYIICPNPPRFPYSM